MGYTGVRGNDPGYAKEKKDVNKKQLHLLKKIRMKKVASFLEETEKKLRFFKKDAKKEGNEFFLSQNLG